MKYLLDTNVFREIGKTAPHEHVRAWLVSVDDADLAISALTVREVTKGVARLAVSKPAAAKTIRARTDAVFDAFAGRILPVDRAVARGMGRSAGRERQARRRRRVRSHRPRPRPGAGDAQHQRCGDAEGV